MADLKIDSVSKRFGDVQAVSDLNLDITSGEFIVLLGPSGAGKTTTLRLVAGLETPEAGSVHISSAARCYVCVSAVFAVSAFERV
jgi:multiple sugar transport system ATP-binding protein